MCSAKSQCLEDIFINGAFMDDDLKVAYLLPDGTPIYTSNPELKDFFDNQAVWEDKDLETIQFWIDGFEELLSNLKTAIDQQEVGAPKYRRLLKQLKPAHDAWMSLRNEIHSRTCFCNKGRLHLPAVNYGDPQWTRREEIETNQYLERKEKI